MARRRYISNSGRYYLPPGYYDADWSYYMPSGKSRRSKKFGRRKNSMNWSGHGRFSAVGGAFGAMAALDSWRMRGQYYDEYFKKTGKRPKYYNKVLRKKVKW